MIDSIAAVLDWLGLVVFATTGALAASRKQMDIVGFALLATAVGIGGGTLRDMMLGALPVFWVARPAYLLVCLAVACVLFFTAHIPQSRMRWLLWLDAVGLALVRGDRCGKGAGRRRGPGDRGDDGRGDGDVRRHHPRRARGRDAGDSQPRDLCLGGAARGVRFRGLASAWTCRGRPRWSRASRAALPCGPRLCIGAGRCRATSRGRRARDEPARFSYDQSPPPPHPPPSPPPLSPLLEPGRYRRSRLSR